MIFFPFSEKVINNDFFSESNQMEQSMAYFDAIPPKDLNIEAYEVLFKALAREGKLEELKKFWTKLKKSAIVPSLKCYIALFQCLGHKNSIQYNRQYSYVKSSLIEDGQYRHLKSIAEELHNELKETNSNNFEFDTLLKNCVPRTKLDYEHLVNGIRLTVPDYVPSIISDKRGEQIYKQNILLKDLYDFPQNRLQVTLFNYGSKPQKPNS